MRRYRIPRYERSIGLERAKAHIEAARQLSMELGGTDRDVKAYFFGLPASEVRATLEGTAANTASKPKSMLKRQSRSGELVEST